MCRRRLLFEKQMKVAVQESWSRPKIEPKAEEALSRMPRHAVKESWSRLKIKPKGEDALSRLPSRKVDEDWWRQKAKILNQGRYQEKWWRLNENDGRKRRFIKVADKEDWWKTASKIDGENCWKSPVKIAEDRVRDMMKFAGEDRWWRSLMKIAGEDRCWRFGVDRWWSLPVKSGEECW